MHVVYTASQYSNMEEIRKAGLTNKKRPVGFIVFVYAFEFAYI